MRAGMVLEALAATHRVALLVVPVYRSFDGDIPDVLRVLCDNCAVVSQSEAADVYRDRSFSTVHVFRLASMAAARSYLDAAGRPFRQLDLDDLESKTRRRLAALCRANGDTELALREESQARRSELLETAAYRRFDRVFVCSDADRREVTPRSPAEIIVLPNAVRSPARVPEPPPDGPFRFLFLGTLGYYPNADAIAYFCERILPEIRRAAPAPFEVDVAGIGASENLRALAAAAGVRMFGRVPEVASLYESAGAVIAPLRAGGGTRIKILEAFSYRRPVVSTSIGIEGIDARPEEHVLVGDAPEEFAQCCLRLMNDRALSDRLAQAAWARWKEAYSLDALKKSVASLATTPTPPESRSGAE
jgi:polysaccharide biosynthesis protein PslH